MIQEFDVLFLREGIRLAEEAERRGNLPVGALVVLDGEIVASGMNHIWQPELAMTRHAEMEALRSLPPELRVRCGEMTLYTTLEPCLMCAGAILLHQIGRLVFGAVDPNAGVRGCLPALPQCFKDNYMRMEWEGPALAVECDPLYERLQELKQG